MSTLTILIGALFASLACVPAWTDAIPEETATCNDRDGDLVPEVFNMRACANCYGFLFRKNKQLHPYHIWLVSKNASGSGDFRLITADISNGTSLLEIQNTLSLSESASWMSCCRDAVECCRTQVQQWTPTNNRTGNDTEADQHCPATWDGFTCWARAPHGEVINQDCPAFFPHVTDGGYSHKICRPNGTWYRHESTDREWTNYTTCIDLKFDRMNMYISASCDLFSLLMLLPAITVFITIRSLRKQPRIRMHLHLFLSFTLHSVVSLLWEINVVYDRMQDTTGDSAMHTNTIWCRVLYVLMRYSRAANFTWMMLEGVYLCHLIVKAFKPPRSLTMFYITGWGFPWIPVISYSVYKGIHLDEKCWVVGLGELEWMLYIPNLACLLANVLFLVFIMKTLLVQLKSHPNEPSTYRRTLKAVSILIPLFGLQLLLVIYNPRSLTILGRLYQIISLVITHSQGSLAAIIFCFQNHEVLHYLTLVWVRRKDNLSMRSGNLPQLLGHLMDSSPEGTFRRDSIFTSRRKNSQSHANMKCSNITTSEKYMQIVVRLAIPEYKVSTFAINKNVILDLL